MGQTTRFLFPYPEQSDSVDVVRDVRALAERSEVVAADTSTMGHMRVRAPSAHTAAAGAWAQIQNLTEIVTADTSGAQPWTVSAGAFTITADGLYEFGMTISGGASTFGLRWQRIAGSVVLAQTTVGAGASQTQTLVTGPRRILAGQVVAALVYPSASMNVVVDAATTPSTMYVTRLSA